MPAFPYNVQACKKLLEADDTFAFVLMTIVLSKYGTECFEEDPAVIFANIKDDFGANTSEETENRINAAIHVLTSDLYTHSFPVFENVALALAEGNIGDDEDEEDEELNTCEILWALYEIALLEGSTIEEVQETLDDSVVDKINAIIDSESEDTEEVADSVDTVAEAFHAPYYNKYVEESLKELLEQIKTIGVSQDFCDGVIAFFRK